MDPPRANRLVVESWRVEDGLPQNTVNAIVQTRDGYIWLGTFDGLARFDGVRFTLFHTGNTPGLPSSRIVSLHEDREGSLWIGTEGGGVSRRRAGRFEAFTPGSGVGSGLVSAIVEEGGDVCLLTDSGLVRYRHGRLETASATERLALVLSDDRGNVWLQAGETLGRLSGAELRPLLLPRGFAADDVRALAVDGTGAVWVGTGRGLLRLKDGSSTRVPLKGGLPSEAISWLREDRTGTVWVGAGAHGVARCAGGEIPTCVTVAPPSGRAQGAARVTEGKDGSIWILSADLLRRVKDGSLTTYALGDALADSRVLSLLGDRDGNLWLGTRGAGLRRLRPAQVTTYGAPEGLPREETQCVLQTRKGDVFIGTNGGGLVRLDGRRLVTYTTRDGLPSNDVWALGEGRDGDLWIGTWGGLGRLHDGVVTACARRALGGTAVLAILEDREGRLWLGTHGRGLARLTDGEITFLTQKDGLVNDYVRTILEDRAGDLWIGTDGGVSRLRNGRFTNYTTRDGLSDGFVRAIHEDDEGTLWIGTYGNGLSRLKRGALRAITPADGLFDHTVSCILEDGRGRFWMTSNKGIYRTTKKQLDDLAEGRIRTISCASVGKPEGMRDAECNGGSQPAGWRMRDGTLWFPTAGGITVIDPRVVDPDTLPPEAVIEEALVDGRAADVRSSPRIPPGAGTLEIRYTGLSFAAPGKIRFRYKLEGADERWLDAGTRRVAYFTRIPPGRYRFRVVAANDDGLWSERAASWEFELAPRFHQTRTFYVLCALAAGLALAAVHHEIVQRLRARNAVLAERTRIAREIHDTVAQGLTGVDLHLAGAEGLLPPGTDGARDYLRKARGVLRDSMEETRCAIAALRPRALEAGTLPGALRLLVDSMTAGSRTEASVVVEGRPRPLPEDAEHDLWSIAREAVANALQHAGCRHVVVHLAYGRWRLRLRVVDDGAGFSSAPVAEGDGKRGFGLVGMRERAQARRWRFDVESRPGRGTTVSVDAPLRGFPWRRHP